MHLSDHSLRQMDEVCVQPLEVEALRGLSLRLLADLKEARDRVEPGTRKQLAAAEQSVALGPAGWRARWGGGTGRWPPSGLRQKF